MHHAEPVMDKISTVSEAISGEDNCLCLNCFIQMYLNCNVMLVEFKYNGKHHAVISCEPTFSFFPIYAYFLDKDDDDSNDRDRKDRKDDRKSSKERSSKDKVGYCSRPLIITMILCKHDCYCKRVCCCYTRRRNRWLHTTRSCWWRSSTLTKATVAIC